MFYYSCVPNILIIWSTDLEILSVTVGNYVSFIARDVLDDLKNVYLTFCKYNTLF